MLSTRFLSIRCRFFLLLVVLSALVTLVRAKWIQCNHDKECPLLTNGRLNICIGRTHILRNGTFAGGYCHDSYLAGDCSTEVDCVHLYRRAGMACVQARSQARGYRQCVLRASALSRMGTAGGGSKSTPCLRDSECSSKGKHLVCLGRGTAVVMDTGQQGQQRGWCADHKLYGKCKTNEDCRARGTGRVCGRTPSGGRACYHATCTSPVVCPAIE